jgi:hypothetical protein
VIQGVGASLLLLLPTSSWRHIGDGCCRAHWGIAVHACRTWHINLHQVLQLVALWSSEVYKKAAFSDTSELVVYTCNKLQHLVIYSVLHLLNKLQHLVKVYVPDFKGETGAPVLHVQLPVAVQVHNAGCSSYKLSVRKAPDQSGKQ